MPKLQAVQQASNEFSGQKLDTPLTDAERRRITAALRGFLDNADTQDQALSLYLNAKVAVRYPTFDCFKPICKHCSTQLPRPDFVPEHGALAQRFTIGNACCVP